MQRLIAIIGVCGFAAGCSTQHGMVGERHERDVRVIEQRENVSYSGPDWSQAKLHGKVDIPPQPQGGMVAFTSHLSYPPHLRARRVSGMVHVRVSLDATGKVVASHITVSGGSQLDAIVLRAVRETKWRPAVRGGKPVPFTFSFPVRFSVESTAGVAWGRVGVALI